MRIGSVAVVIGLALTSVSCSRQEDGGKKSAAHEVGKVGYEVTKEAEKVAKKAGEKIKEATHEASQGWKEAQRAEKTKAKVK